MITGVSLRDTIALIGVALLQTTVGTRLNRSVIKSPLAPLAHVSVGFASGAIVATVVDQLVVNLSVPNSRIITTLILIALVLVLQNKGTEAEYVGAGRSDLLFILSSLIVLVLGYGTFAHGRGVVVAIGIFSICAFTLTSVRKSFTKSLGLTFLTIVTQFVILVVQRPNPPTYGRLLYLPLYTGSDDQIFSESLGWSLSHFGINEYAASSGVSVKYHWFSLAWSGFVDKISGVEPLTTTLHAVPVFSILAIACLTRAVISQVVNNPRAEFAGVFLVFGLAGQLEPTRFIHVLNTSNVASYLWFLLLMFCLVMFAKQDLRLAWIFLPFLSAVNLLSKVPFGLISTVSLLGTLMFVPRTHPLARRLKIMGITLASFVTTFALFLRPHTWEVRSFAVDFHFGNLAIGSSFYPLVPVVLISLTMASILIGLPTFLGRSLNPGERTLVTFLAFASIAGVVRFFLLGGSAELYFFNLTLFCGGLLNAIAFAPTFSRLNHRYLLITCSIVSLAFILKAMMEPHRLLGVVIQSSSLEILSPIAIGVLLAVLGYFARHRFEFFKTVGFWFVALLGVVGVSFEALAVNMAKAESFAGAAEIASTEDLQALRWLRLNSPESALVATNRYLCPSNQSCDFDESRYLISAVARRKVLIEGPRFVIGGKPYPSWAKSRIDDSINFAETLSEESKEKLMDAGVSWFFLSKEFVRSPLKLEKLSEFADVVYESPKVALIRFKQ